MKPQRETWRALSEVKELVNVRVTLKPRGLVHRAGEGEVCLSQGHGLWVHAWGKLFNLAEPQFPHL